MSVLTRTTVILGAGVTGLSTAYHLARKGCGKVILIDKGPVGDGSSSRAAGIITGLLWSETGVLARKISLRLFHELSNELDNYKFQNCGALNLFDRLSWPERERLLALYRRCGAPFEVLNADEIRSRWPSLHPQEEYIGLYDPQGGYSEPDAYIPALARRCRELGVEIREFQQVTGFTLHNGRVTGVRTMSDTIAADAVVSTVYAWTNQLLAEAEIRLPVKAVVHQRYVTRPLETPPAIPAVNADPLGGYVRPAAGNRLLFGIETAEREEFRVDRSDFHLRELDAPEALAGEIRANFTPFLPALANVDWDERRLGLLTFSMDGEPLIGPVARLPGLFVGLAFHSGGFAYNPVSGMLLAEFVAHGQTSLDISAFSPDRFDPAATDAYLAETVKQKHVSRRRH